MRVPWELDVRGWDRWDWLYAACTIVIFGGVAALIFSN